MQTSEVEVELAPLHVGFLNLINVPPYSIFYILAWAYTY